MSQRIQIVLPDPVALQLREPPLAPTHHTRHSPHSSSKTKSPAPSRTATFVRCAQPPCSPTPTAASDRPGSSPTAATPNGASKCGAPSSPYAAATPNSSNRSKTNGGPTNQPSRHSARSPSGEQNSTKHAKTPATTRIPNPAQRLLPTPTPKRRRRHQGMEARRDPAGVGRRLIAELRVHVRESRPAEDRLWARQTANTGLIAVFPPRMDRVSFAVMGWCLLA